MEINAKNKTRIEQLIKYIRNTPLFKQLVPMESLSGWPYLSKKNGKVYLSVPFYGTANKEKGQTVLYPPLALITVECETNTLVEYLNLKYTHPWSAGDWESPAGIFPHEEIKDMTVYEYREKKQQMMNIYELLHDLLKKGEMLDVKMDREFSELLELMLEPSLKPFYTALAPNFFGHFLRQK